MWRRPSRGEPPHFSWQGTGPVSPDSHEVFGPAGAGAVAKRARSVNPDDFDAIVAYLGNPPPVKNAVPGPLGIFA